MALCSEPCGGDSSSSKAGPSCLQFGVRSYLHNFYEECSSSMQDRGPEDGGQRSTLWWNSVVWKVFLALGVLILTTGVASLSAGYSTPPRIESFGDGDLFFVDAQAISFNRGLHLTTVAGIGLSCLGSALVAMGVFVWIIPRAERRERPVQRPGGLERRGKLKSKGFRCSNDVVTEPPAKEEGGLSVQPAS